MEINVIVFSKDRPCQVTACLESFLKYFASVDEASISVLYKASNKDFEEGYELSKSMFSSNKINWTKEENFRKQTIDLVSNKSPLTMFLVDDIIFVNKLNLNDKEIEIIKNNGLMLGTSLRLHKDVNYCYAVDKPCKVPNFVKGYVWNWRESEYDWAYPCSLDGNIYKTNFISQLISNLNFINPNSLEASLDNQKRSSFVPNYLSCYVNGPRLINLPANLVQNVYKNKTNNDLTAEELNGLFLNGNKIDIKAYSELKPNSVHVAMNIKLLKV